MTWLLVDIPTADIKIDLPLGAGMKTALCVCFLLASFGLGLSEGFDKWKNVYGRNNVGQ